MRRFSTHSPSLKTTLTTINNLYKSQTPIVMMTAHDYPSSLNCNSSNIDIILVGDSLGMVSLGYPTTLDVTVEDMLLHCRSVHRGNVNSFVIGDFPFGSYNTPKLAMETAVRFIKEGKVEAVKLEGGKEIKNRIQAITELGIPVIGHAGLMPQKVLKMGGYKAQGRTLESAKILLEDALTLQDAGVFAIVLECVPQCVASFITKKLRVPTIGIGAGAGCSGQVLVQMDILGIYEGQTRFSKRYEEIGARSRLALKNYADDVRARRFPQIQHTYKMVAKEEEDIFNEWVKTQ